MILLIPTEWDSSPHFPLLTSEVWMPKCGYKCLQSAIFYALLWLTGKWKFAGTWTEESARNLFDRNAKR